VLDRARQGALLRSGLNVVLVGAAQRRQVQPAQPARRRGARDRHRHRRHHPRRAARDDPDRRASRCTSSTPPACARPTDRVERIGIERTWREIARADVILRLVECGGHRPTATIDARLPQGVERIVVANKIDLAGLPPGRVEAGGRVRLQVSARSGEGVELVRQELLRIAGWHAHGEDVILARERHLLALREALAHVEAAGTQLGALELFAEELRLAQEELGDDHRRVRLRRRPARGRPGLCLRDRHWRGRTGDLLPLLHRQVTFPGLSPLFPAPSFGDN
jgi:tRNA modification GTPase